MPGTRTPPEADALSIRLHALCQPFWSEPQYAKPGLENQPCLEVREACQDNPVTTGKLNKGSQCTGVLFPSVDLCPLRLQHWSFQSIDLCPS
eukprot:204520-Amphidinium_carterae.1